MGYAIPGAVIAVGVLIPFARLDNALDAWMRGAFGISTGLLLTGTVGGLLFAYLVRFLALALNSVEAGPRQDQPQPRRCRAGARPHPGQDAASGCTCRCCGAACCRR